MVLNGIDRIDAYAGLFQNKRLGMITSVSGVDRKLRSSIEILHRRYGLTALFGPEHGVRGDVDAGGLVETYTDSETGLPVYSLYRKESKRLTPEMLDLVDAVVYDIQDLGTRYYTFISTLLYAIEDCAKAGKELIVLDRLNPLGGEVCEGNVQDESHLSFVGAYPLCMRYGLTAGELAMMVNEERRLGCKLTVVPCENWRRRQLFCETGNLWMMPSLGIPRFDTALLYPGMCLLEGTNLSEGRGTSCPFEIIGAPYVNAMQLAHALGDLYLPGVLFTAAYFTPTASKHMGVACQGVHAHITDAHAFRPVQTGLTLLYTVQSLYGADFAFLPPVKEGARPFISLLFGSGAFNDGVLPPLADVLAQCERDAAAFAARKAKYHLYE